MSWALADRISGLAVCRAVWIAVRAAFRDGRERVERVWEAREADWAEVSGDEDVKDMVETVLKLNWIGLGSA